jgi:hypothetical protein
MTTGPERAPGTAVPEATGEPEIPGLAPGHEDEAEDAVEAELAALEESAEEPAPVVRVAALAIPALAGVVVSIALGVFARVHAAAHPAALHLWGGIGGELKVGLTVAAVVLALAQGASALVMYGKVPVTAPNWISTAHRWTGRAAFTATIPVAVHCLYALGFQASDARVLLHGLAGCVLYGAFTVKMLVLTRDDTPSWALPVAGGVVLTAVVGAWLTTAHWLFG